MNDSNPPKREHRPFQFRLRTLLIVVLVLMFLGGTYAVRSTFSLGAYS